MQRGPVPRRGGGEGGLGRRQALRRRPQHRLPIVPAGGRDPRPGAAGARDRGAPAACRRAGAGRPQQHRRGAGDARDPARARLRRRRDQPRAQPLPAAPPLRPVRRGAAELRADRRDAEPRLHQGGASRHRALAGQQRRDLRPRARAARPPRGGDRQPQVHPDQPGDRDRRLCDAARQRLRLRQLRLRRQAGVPGAEPLGGHLSPDRGQGLRRGRAAASSGSAARGWCTRASTWCSRPSRGCPTCI